jgi:small subunit ribosomal protein S1
MNNEVENHGEQIETTGNVNQPEMSETRATESFEQLLSDYDFQAPKRGQLLEGKIIRIDEDAILVDVGLKRDALVQSREIDQLDSGYLEKLEVGDQVLVYVVHSPTGDQDLIVSLSKGIEFKSWENAQSCLDQGSIIDVEVHDYNKGGLLVKFEQLHGFVPASQIPELRRGGGRERLNQIKQEMVGSMITVKTIEVDRDRNRLVFSVLAAQEQRRNQRLQELEEGQIVLRATVASVVDFGVFVDLQGVDGLVHVSELDWKMVKHPASLFKPGDEIDVQIISIDVKKERVSLSRKALLPNPWVEVEERYHPGDVIQGEVTRIMDFGAFVEITDGIEGLVHSSEVGYAATGKPQEVVQPGETILVRVLSVDIKRGRLSLSMRRVPIGEQIKWVSEHDYDQEQAVSEDASEIEEEKPDEDGSV